MNLPDDLADLERELAARSRQQPSTNLRPRVLSAVARALAQPSNSTSPLPARRNHHRQLLIAIGIAASIAMAFAVWRWNSLPRPSSPLHVAQPVVLVLPSDDRLTTWRDCRLALNHSPNALDQLLERNAAKSHSPSPQNLLHTHTNFLATIGDL
jgi:hypothetical protein